MPAQPSPTDAPDAWLNAVRTYAETVLAGHTLPTGEPAHAHAQGAAQILNGIGTDVATQGAAWLFPVDFLHPAAQHGALIEDLTARFGAEVVQLIVPLRQLLRLRELTLGQLSETETSGKSARDLSNQIEVLRKMVLAMAADIRVVLLRLASRLQTMRFFAASKASPDDAAVREFANETMQIYAPLANRLGIWQLKWELEDLAFRFLEPDTYKKIARQLDEKRVEREQFIHDAIARLHSELAKQGITADISGRPKHIYSIVNKLRGKSLQFDQLYDVRALRVICTEVKDCYTVLGLLHHLWKPIAEEFDDYIARPKPNGYQSLHTVLVSEDGRPFEVQIRTRAMHQFAEYGVAAHWRYKEAGSKGYAGGVQANQDYDARIAWLRQLLAWKTEVTDTVVDTQQWAEQLKAAALDERIYVLTPEARVIDLPAGSTPIDFAYHLHSDLGHRCRGAKVDGVMVPLNTVLKNGQTVEIVVAKQGGPSRDWLNPQLGFLRSTRSRAKVRQWFNAVELEETRASGRAILEKELQRLGKTAASLEDLAQQLGFEKADDLFIAIGREVVRPRQIAEALGLLAPAETVDLETTLPTRSASASSVERGAKSGVLVVGVDALMTQLARCCRPAPPDPIIGFVTRGRGVSIHRLGCSNLAAMLRRSPERSIEVTWGQRAGALYPVDIIVLANDRQGLLRDISEVLAREKINVIGVNTQSEGDQARMRFTTEIVSTQHLQRALGLIREVRGVTDARRK
ncbi:MAG: bifunctional (p)ppGpp synthetase/guanosine-3',5'-bis(diphosphate) 3'-pyrophosphohydrolase [Burkholderiaceae bacterium]|nr:MAG: bifunctional (p)ppGpp synthetase/guanosine-3',5'-bis(diphosphate) 3'-pyrophosphohydrolase [Burkholderiaceae bacterium]